MAIKTYAITLNAAETAVQDEATDGTTAALAQLSTDIAAAQAIGTGDASAEIDTLDTTFQTIIDPTALAPIVITVDEVIITTKNQLKAALNSFIATLEDSDIFVD